ncbi:MAG: hypothetical protein KBD01_12100 [Acidobacteria bacterium]|nr:hypothetical protein [Acidobacteriota bacterium]
MSARGAVLALAALAFAPAGTQAQTSISERQLAAARDLERDGQLEQARALYRQIVERDPAGAWSDDALLALARLAAPIDSPQRLGEVTVPTAMLEQARADLERIRKEMPASDSAPEAMYRLALLRLVPQSPSYDVDEATALLTTLPVLHPGAPQVPEARVLAARLHLHAGRTDRARALAFESLTAEPNGPLAAEAWDVLAQAEARSGTAEGVLPLLGKAQLAGPPDSPTVARAIDLATLADRLAFAGARAAGPFAAAEATPLAGKPADLAVDGNGTVHAALPRDNAILSLARGAQQFERRAAQGIIALGVDGWGRLCWVGAPGITLGDGTVIAVPPDVRPVAIAPAGPRGAWIVDDRANRLIRVEPGGAAAATAALPPRALPAAAVADGQGGAWVLELRAPSLVHVGANGELVGSVSLAGTAEKPVDLERDELGNVYVLDARSATVLLFAPTGKPLLRWPQAVSGGESPLAKATLLTVERTGALGVYDSRAGRFTWYR